MCVCQHKDHAMAKTWLARQPNLINIRTHHIPLCCHTHTTHLLFSCHAQNGSRCSTGSFDTCSTLSSPDAYTSLEANAYTSTHTHTPPPPPPTHTHTQVAVKVPSMHLSNVQAVTNDLKREIETMARLNHPNIVRLLGITEGKPPYAACVSD